LDEDREIAQENSGKGRKTTVEQGLGTTCYSSLNKRRKKGEKKRAESGRRTMLRARSVQGEKEAIEEKRQSENEKEEDNPVLRRLPGLSQRTSSFSDNTNAGGSKEGRPSN